MPDDPLTRLRRICLALPDSQAADWAEIEALVADAQRSVAAKR